MASNLGSQCSEQIFGRKKIQNGDPRNNPDLPTRRMGDIAGLQQRLFPHPHTQKVSEIPEIPFPEPDLSIQSASFRPLTSSYGVHLHGQGSQVDGSSLGYKNPPVPGQLVDLSPQGRVLPPGHSVPPRPLPGVGLGSELSKIRIRTQAGI